MSLRAERVQKPIPAARSARSLRSVQLPLVTIEPDGRKRNESKYRGNDERCPGCQIRYGSFKVGVSFAEVLSWLWSPSEDSSQWRPHRRRTVLEKIHQIKREY